MSKIGPALENLILSGEAVHEIHPLGGTQTGRIKCGTNDTLIVVGFTYASFADDTGGDTNEHINHQLRMTGGGKVRTWAIRSDALSRNNEQRGAMYNFWTYDVYTDDIFVTISKILTATGWTFPPATTIADVASISRPTINVGTDANKGFAINQIVQDSSNNETKPLGDLTPSTPGKDTRDGFQWPVDTSTRLNLPTVADTPDISYPIINVEVVRIFKRINTKIK